MNINGWKKYIINKIIVQDEINKNSICEVDLSIENDKIQNYIDKIENGKNSLVVSKEENVVFTGDIEQIECKRTYLCTNVHIIAIAFSKVLDSEIHNRVFQNPYKTYTNLCEKFSTEQVKIKCIDENFGKQVIGDVLIQHNETDFEFLRKIFNKKNQNMYILNNKKNQCTIEIAQKRNIYNIPISEQEIHRFKQTRCSKYEIVEFSTKVWVELGSMVEIFRKRYRIIARKSVTENEVEEIYYTAIQYFKTNIMSDVFESYSIGLAKVVDNVSEEHMGKIQVEFLEYEDAMPDEKIWIDYMSPLTDKDGGIIALPDKGEIVEVFYRNKQCIAIGCIRKVGINENYQNLNNRYYVSRGCIISNGDRSIEIMVGKKHIKISDTDIKLSNEEFDVSINEELCKIGYENTKILLNKDILQILSSKKVDIKTGEINLAGENVVKAKTRSFDIG